MPEYINKIRTSSGDLPVNYEALANLPTISNPNLLINSDFRNPINQRGSTTLTTDNSDWNRFFFIDRWYIQHGATAELKDGYVRLQASSSTTEAFFSQPFEHSLVEGEYTTTINVKSVTGTVKVHGIQLVQGVNIIHNSWEFERMDIRLLPSSTVELYWVKVEYGTTSTAFTPRLRSEELLMCKRYYQNYKDNRFAVLTQTYTTTTTTNGRFNLPIEMIDTPMISIYSLEVKNVNNGTTISITSSTGNAISNDVVEISGVHASTAVSQRYMYAKFSADAEIYG